MFAILAASVVPALLHARAPLRCAAPRAAMKQHQLGSSDLRVSSCCLGTMTWGNQNTADEAAEQLSLAIDAGVNFIDTAEGYPIPLDAETQGATDRAIGAWLKTSGQPRDSIVLASKVCGFNERFTWFRGGTTRVTREQVIASVDASLSRLGTDHIDLLQIHWPDRYVPLFGSTRYDVSKEREGSVSFEEQVEVRLPRPALAPNALATTAPPRHSPRRTTGDEPPLRRHRAASASRTTPSSGHG